MTDTSLHHTDFGRLAETSEWAHRLAMRLVGDSHLAEDVVQEAYLAALRHPDAARTPTAWLAGTIRNLAIGKRRDRARREVRERRASREEAVPSAADAAARLEQQEVLICAILEIDEPFRGALIARHVDGLSPRAIAARDDVPVATVNGRIARGMTRLRARLNAKHGDDNTRWIAAMAPLLRPPSVVKGSMFLGTLTMKKTIVAAILLFLLLPLGWYVAALPTVAGPPAPMDVEVTAVTPAPPVGTDLASVGVADDGRTDAEAEQGPTLSAAEDEFAGAETRSLLVIDSLGRAPVPDAEVWVVSSQAFGRVSLERQLDLARSVPDGFRALSREQGRSFRTGDDGRVDIPVTQDGVTVLGRGGDRHGIQFISTHDDVSLLMIGRDRIIEVAVVDASGEALPGVPVHIATSARLGGTEALTLYTVSRTTTQAGDGRAIATLALAHDLARGDDIDSPLVVALDFPLAERVEVPIYRTRWPDEPVTLMLPEVGTVALDVRNGDSNAPAGDLVVGVRRATESGPMAIGQTGGCAFVLDDGRASLWPVGLGLDLTASFRLSAAGMPLERSFQGPRVKDEVREVRLSIATREVELVGRVVDTGGAAPSGSPLFAYMDDAIVDGGLDVGADGSFSVRVAIDDASAVGHRFALIENGGLHRIAVLPLPDLGGEERIDLGVLRLQHADELIPGEEGPEDGKTGFGVDVQIVDPSGSPIEGASVAFVQLTPTDGARPRWSPLAREAVSDANGQARVTAEEELGADVYLQAAHRGGLRHEPVPLAQIGDAPIVLTMEPGARLDGRLVLDEGITPEWVRVCVWDEATGPAPAGPHVNGWITAKRHEDGRFSIQGLAPGSYTVRAGASRREAGAVVIEGVELRPGENRDSRLTPLDLRGRYRMLDIIVVNEDDEPLGASVFGFEHAGDASSNATSGPVSLGWTGSGAIMVPMHVPQTLVVRADGYFPARIDPRSIPEPVVLRRGFDTTLNWIGAGSLDRIPGDLLVELLPASTGTPRDRVDGYLSMWSPRPSSSIHDGPAPFGANGAASARIPGAGMYELNFTVQYVPRPGMRLERTVRLAEAPMVNVTRQGERFDAALDEAALADAIQSIRERFDAAVESGQLPKGLEFGAYVFD
jgi:RNA polymerase sigma-70 factor (ECF subfamily)